MSASLIIAWAMPALTATFVWQWIFDTEYGIVDTAWAVQLCVMTIDVDVVAARRVVLAPRDVVLGSLGAALAMGESDPRAVVP